MKWILSFGFLLICFFSVHSNTLTVIGKVTDENTGLPVESASVFIANTTIGTYSNENGGFKLSFPQMGVLNLIVSHVSYQTFSKNISMENDSLFIQIKLKTQIYKLQSVNVNAKDPNREAKIKAFTKGFLGQSKNALKCKLENPSVLHLIGPNPLNTIVNSKLNVFADSALIIKNEALGYTLKYNLIYFTINLNIIGFYGYPLFEDMYESKQIPQRILDNRKLTYEGSKLHFFRSLYTKNLENEGFEIYKMDMLKKARFDFYDYGLLADSLFIGYSKVVLKQTNEKLNLYDYLTFDTISGSCILTIREPFEIKYTGRREEYRYNDYSYYFWGIKRAYHTQTTIARIINESIRFYSNGSFEKSDNLISLGYWSYKSISDLLPYNFSLVDKKSKTTAINKGN